MFSIWIGGNGDSARTSWKWFSQGFDVMLWFRILIMLSLAFEHFQNIRSLRYDPMCDKPGYFICLNK